MKDLSDSPLSVTLKSVRFRDSAIFAASVTLPILMDVISELCNSIVRRNTPHRIKMRPKKPLLNTIERFMLYCGIMTIPITAFLDPDTANLGNIYQCLRRSRTILVFGAVVTSLGRYDKKFWSPTVTYALLAFLISGATTGSFSDNSDGGSLHEIGLEMVKWLYLATALTFFSCNGFWLYTNLPHFFKMMWRGKDTQSIQSEQQYRIFPLLYATATSVFFLGSMLSSSHYGEEDNYGADALFLHNLMFILYLLLQMYMSERMLKCEVVEGLVRSRSPPLLSPFPSRECSFMHILIPSSSSLSYWLIIFISIIFFICCTVFTHDTNQHPAA
jgi:hypothetical protein